MTTGLSGTYAVNGTEFLAPTTHRWIERESLGFDGNGRPIYAAVGEYELNWELMSVADLQTLINFGRASQTGTVVVDLPQWGAAGYLFNSYSGTYFNRPKVDSYFAEYVQGVSVIINNIRTD